MESSPEVLVPRSHPVRVSDRRPPLSRPVVVLLLIATVVAAEFSLFGSHGDLGHAGLLLVWLLACIGGEIFWFKTPGYDSTLSLALTLDVAAIAALSPREALVVVGASTLFAGALAHRRQWYRVAFNVAQSVLAAAAAAFVFRGVANTGGIPESPVVPTLAILSAGITFFFVNTTFVSIAVGLSENQAPWIVWVDCYGTPLELAGTFGQLSLAYFVTLACHLVGPAALLGAFPVLLALWYGSTVPAVAKPPAPAE